MGDGGVRAVGVVRDVSGTPVRGALVFFDDPGHDRWPTLFEVNSRPDGSFELYSTVAPGRYDIPLIVRAEGFKPAAIKVPTLSQNKVLVTLVPLSGDSESVATLTTGK